MCRGLLDGVTFGSYNYSCYSTIEVACFLPDGECSPANGAILPLKGNLNLVGTGGASL
jgi:hypothetical protein